MTSMGHIPVDREAPAAAYLRARAELLAGQAVGVFPEAGISVSYTVRSMMPGAVALSRVTNAPIVPMALWGTQRIAGVGHRVSLRRRRPITIVVGDAMAAPDGDLRQATRELGARLQDLLDQAQAIHLDRPAPGERATWLPAHLGGHAPTPSAAALNADLPRTAITPDPGPFFR